MTPEERKEDWAKKISYLLDNPDVLNDWEGEFVDSMELQLSLSENLTMRQSSKLREIYNRLSG